MKNTFILIFFALSLQISAQLQNTNWYFGSQASVNFNDGTSPPTIINNSSLNTLEGCASVSDSSGSLLFYTNGVTVWNRNNEIMLNGENLLGHISSTQSAIIIQDLSNESKYYIFTSNGESGNRLGFHYSIVNMNLDNNLGGIILGSKNLDLYNSNGIPFNHSNSEKITSYFNRDENIVWIIIYHRNKIFSFKLDENGFNPQSFTSTSILLPFPNNYPVGIGTLKVAPNGQQLAISFGLGAGTFDSVFTANFNDMTGQISNFTSIPLGGVYSVEFSPNSQYLYMHTFLSINQITTRQINNNNEKIFRIDIKNNEIKNIEFASSITEIANGLHVGTLQTAIDGKIYYNNGEFLGVIHNPNEEATQLNIDNNYLFLHRSSGVGLPQKVPEICFGEWPVIYETNSVKNKSIAADSQNNIYLLDIRLTNIEATTYLSKYNFCGEELWSINISNKAKQTFDVQVDSNDDVILTYHTSEADIYNNWYYIEKYSPNGTLIYKYGFDRKPIAFDINKRVNETYLLLDRRYYDPAPLNVIDNDGNNVLSTNIRDFLILKINSDNSFNNNIQSKIYVTDPITPTFNTRINDIEFSESTNKIYISGIIETSTVTIDNINSFSVNGNNQIFDTFVIKYTMGFGNIIYNSHVVSNDNLSPYDGNKQSIEYNEDANKLFIITGNTINQYSNNLIFEQSYQINGWGTCDTFFNQNDNYLLVGNSSKIFKIKNGLVLEIIDEYPVIQNFARQYSITQTPNNYIFSSGLWNEPSPPNSNIFGVYIDRFNEYGEESRINLDTLNGEESEVLYIANKTLVSPNPFTSQIKIKSCDNTKCLRNLSLFDSQLIEIKNIHISKLDDYWLINTSNLKNGLYFVKLRYRNEKNLTIKIIKE